MKLLPREALVVDEALEDIHSEPPPRDWGPFGCGIGFGGFLLLLAVPVIGRALGRALSVGLISGGVVMLALGIVVWKVAAGSGSSRIRAAVEAALRELEQGTGDRDVALRAATLLLTHAYMEQGPTTVQSFGRMEAAARLGDAMTVVLEVEEYLLERDAIYPVFSREGKP